MRRSHGKLIKMCHWQSSRINCVLTYDGMMEIIMIGYQFVPRDGGVYHHSLSVAVHGWMDGMD